MSNIYIHEFVIIKYNIFFLILTIVALKEFRIFIKINTVKLLKLIFFVEKKQDLEWFQ